MPKYVNLDFISILFFTIRFTNEKITIFVFIRLENKSDLYLVYEMFDIFSIKIIIKHNKNK